MSVPLWLITSSYTSGQSAANKKVMMGYNPKKDYQLRNKKSYESGLGRNQFTS